GRGRLRAQRRRRDRRARRSRPGAGPDRRAGSRGRTPHARRPPRAHARGALLRGADRALVNRSRVWVIARTELRQLRQSPDFWLPMLILAALLFIVIPTVLLFALTHVPNEAVVKKVAVTLDVLPARAKAAIHGFSPARRT